MEQAETTIETTATVVPENNMKISDKDYEEIKKAELDIAVAQRKIGDLEIKKSILLEEAKVAMDKFRELQIFLYKKHDLNMGKSYAINDQTKEFVLQN